MSTVPPSRAATPRRFPLWLRAALAAVGLFLLAGAGGAWYLARRGDLSRAEPPSLFAVPDFRLTERSGRPLRLDALRGRPWIADFIFTRCGGQCPAMTARMARLRRELPEMRFVSFTVDPAHDTTDVLSAYADAFHAGPDWLFVTGPQKDLYALSVDGFKLAALETPPGQASADGPFVHSARFVLVDASAVVRGYYDSTSEEEMRGLVADAAALRTGP